MRDASGCALYRSQRTASFSLCTSRGPDRARVMPRGWSGNQNRVIRGCGSGVYFTTQCLKQTSRRVPNSPGGLNGRIASVIASLFSSSRPPPPARASYLEHLHTPDCHRDHPLAGRGSRHCPRRRAPVARTTRRGPRPRTSGNPPPPSRGCPRRRSAPTRPRRFSAAHRPPRSRTQSARPERAPGWPKRTV